MVNQNFYSHPTEVMASDAEDIMNGYQLRDLELSLEQLLMDEETKVANSFAL